MSADRSAPAGSRARPRIGATPARPGRPARALRALPFVAALVATGCATSLDNRPLNAPVTPAFVRLAEQPRGLVDRNVIALSLSGGGLRAAAFGLGVLQALDGGGTGAQGAVPAAGSVFGDVTFISSVSGGSLTAAWTALHGRDGLYRMRDEVLGRDFERGLRVNLLSPANWMRLLAGGLNDRSNLARTLDEEVFGGATFSRLLARRKPDVWINATDLYNRTPFPFTPQAFLSVCSDLSSLRVSEAVAASMAVPLVFAPVVLKTYPDECLTPLAPRAAALLADPGRIATDPAAATARAMHNYRDRSRMRYVKLADGGLTDNQGLSSILIARTVSGTPYGPLTASDAIRLRRMLFLIVDAGRPPAGTWALQPDGPTALDLGLAAADSAIDSATRLSVDAFRTMIGQWRASLIAFRCGLSEADARVHLDPGEPWRCADVEFFVDTVSAESLDPATALRLREMPTRLVLPPADIDAAIEAGRAATLASPALREYLRARLEHDGGSPPPAPAR